MNNYSAISWLEQVTLKRDDDEVLFVPIQHPKLDFDSASSLNQQSAGRHLGVSSKACKR